MRLAHQDCHPERSEGSRSEILRYAQNDTPGGSVVKRINVLNSDLGSQPLRSVSASKTFQRRLFRGKDLGIFGQPDHREDFLEVL